MKYHGYKYYVCGVTRLNNIYASFVDFKGDRNLSPAINDGFKISEV